MATRQRSKKTRRTGAATPQGYLVRVHVLDADTRRVLECLTLAGDDGRDVWRHYEQAERAMWRYLEQLAEAEERGELGPGLTFRVEVERAWGADRRVWLR
jgi:hypothetical protein